MKAMSHKYRGLTLYELCIYLALLAVLGLVATRIAGSSLRLTRDTATAHDAIHAFDAEARQLRADVWSAAEIRVTSSDQVVLKQGDGGTIRWTVGDGIFTRTFVESSVPTTQSIRHIPASFAFRADGDALILAVDGDDRFTFASQLMRLRKERP